MSQLENQRHSLAHLLATAVLEQFPDTKLGVGPVIEHGFYYDFLLPRPLTPDDLPKLEARMKELIKAGLTFEKQTISATKAKQFFTERQQQFKVELITDLERAGEEITLYKTGEFIDLCRGGHVDNTSELDAQAFSLHKISGAYWRGDQKLAQLQRIYGLAFSTAEELQKYQQLQSELEKRDHRVLGPQLGLFLFHEYAPGIPFYQPNGTIVRNELEQFVREVSYGDGYHEVRLPQLFDAELFKTSGHWDHYKDDMFTLESENRTFGLKPMNCPGHMLYYKQGLYSYKDLPLRLSEMSTLYRNELSGTLSGLTRVRAFAQDDAHIFLTSEQITNEVANLLNRINTIYNQFEMKVEKVTLGTKPAESLGTKAEWEQAENALAAALQKSGWEFEREEGDGAFYGPKIDMRIKDVLGREWQLATVQLDFQMPQRFELEYVAQDGSRQTPIVIHRAILGSFERFLAILIEQYAGALPVWLAPIQAKILPVSDKFSEYAEKVKAELTTQVPTLRINIDNRSESIGKRIREAATQKIPYLLIVGEKEVESNTVAVRGRDDQDLGVIPISEFAQTLTDKILNRK
ncbi:MAG TPA: threonine--tRNA ligase [Candidatus Doudnabacteria bacterium]|nr:threonine--tRNA ligase [Candidatus Doudnabacteria bacterium]